MDTFAVGVMDFFYRVLPFLRFSMGMITGCNFFMKNLILFSILVAWGVSGFVAGVLASLILGFHEKQYVMSIGFLSALAITGSSFSISRKLLSSSSLIVKFLVLPLASLLGPVSVGILYKAVGY